MRLLEHGALALSAQADVAESVRAWESGDISSVIFLPSPARSRWSPREHGITFRQPTGAWSLERFEEFKAKQQPLWSLFGQLLVCAGRSPHQRRSRRDSTPLHSRRHSRHAPSLQFACCFRLVRIRFCVLARSTLRALRRRRDGCRRWWKLLQLRTRRFSRPRSSHYFTRMSTVLGSFPQVRATSARSRMASTPRLSTRQAPGGVCARLHVLVIPKRRLYNAVLLRASDVPLLDHMASVGRRSLPLLPAAVTTGPP